MERSSGNEVEEVLDFIDELHGIVSKKSCLPKYVIVSKQERINQLLISPTLAQNYKTLLLRYSEVIRELYNPLMRD